MATLEGVQIRLHVHIVRFWHEVGRVYLGSIGIPAQPS